MALVWFAVRDGPYALRRATSPRRRHTVLPALLAALLQLLRLAPPRDGGACQSTSRGQLLTALCKVSTCSGWRNDASKVQQECIVCGESAAERERRRAWRAPALRPVCGGCGSERACLRGSSELCCCYTERLAAAPLPPPPLPPPAACWETMLGDLLMSVAAAWRCAVAQYTSCRRMRSTVCARGALTCRPR